MADDNTQGTGNPVPEEEKEGTEGQGQDNA